MVSRQSPVPVAPRRSRAALAEWSAAYINDLPDSAFLHIEPGGEKDEDGKTVPRSLRHFPVRDAAGEVDMPHLRNALARIPQSNLPQAAKDHARAEADRLMEEHGAGEDMAAAERAAAGAPNLRDCEPGGDCCCDCRYMAAGPAGVNACRLYCCPVMPSQVCDGFRSCGGMMFMAEPRLRLVAVGDRETDGSVWIEVLRTGEHHAGHVGGSASSGQKAIAVDDAMIQSLQRGTAVVLADGRYPSGIPVRLDPTHADASGPAVGRIVETRVDKLSDGGSRLLARVVWTDEGRRTIEAGEYDSCSIEADPPGSVQDKRTGAPIDDWALTGLVVTNHPFVAGMDPLAASDRARATREIDMALLKLLLPALALTESATEAEAVAAVQRLTEQARRADALALSVSTLTTERDALKMRLGEADAWRQKRMLDDACAVGRIAAGERDRYSKVVAALGEDEAHKVFPEGRVRVAQRSFSGAETSTGEGVALSDAALSDAVNAEARRIAAEKGINLADAYAEAMHSIAAKHPAVAARYAAPAQS